MRGLVEVKAPRAANHLRYLREFGVPKEHEAQCLHLLWLTGAQWIDFVSYCPQFPEHLQYLVRRMERDDDAIAAYDKKVRAFLEEVEAEANSLHGFKVLEFTKGAA